MSYLTKLLVKNARPLAAKAKDVVGENVEKVGEGIDRVVEAVDGRTQGRHTAKIDKAAGTARKLVDRAEADVRRKRPPAG